jgi:hypothetical protein
VAYERVCVCGGVGRGCINWLYLVLNYKCLIRFSLQLGSTAERRWSADCFMYVYVCIYTYTLYVYIVVFNNILRTELVH